MTDSKTFTHRLDRITLCERIRDHTKEAYLLIYNVMKGIALANAAYTLACMLTKRPYWPAYILWGASMSALLVSHLTTMTGILLSTSRRNPFDTVLPFALSITEFLLFSTLQPEVRNHIVIVTWRSWYLAYGAWSLTACLLILNRVLQTKVSDVDPADRPLSELMCSFKKKLWENLCVAGVLALLSLGFGLLLGILPPIAEGVHGLLGGVVLVTMTVVLIKNEVGHRSILAVAKGERWSDR